MRPILKKTTILKALNFILVVVLFLSIFPILTSHFFCGSAETTTVLLSPIRSPGYIETMGNNYPFGTDAFIPIEKISNLETILNFRLILFGKVLLDEQKNKEENNEILTKRSIIKETIEKNPGITLREIQRTTGYALGVIQYHLSRLENHEIEAFRLGRCKHFFSSQSFFSPKEIMWLSVTRNQNIKNILRFLKSKENGCSQRDIVDFTGISKVMVSYYVKQLKQFGVIDRNHYRIQIREDYLFMSNSSI